jgi:hypothetical protein
MERTRPHTGPDNSSGWVLGSMDMNMNMNMNMPVVAMGWSAVSLSAPLTLLHLAFD